MNSVSTQYNYEKKKNNFYFHSVACISTVFFSTVPTVLSAAEEFAQATAKVNHEKWLIKQLKIALTQQIYIGPLEQTQRERGRE